MSTSNRITPSEVESIRYVEQLEARLDVCVKRGVKNDRLTSVIGLRSIEQSIESFIHANSSLIKDGVSRQCN